MDPHQTKAVQAAVQAVARLSVLAGEDIEFSVLSQVELY